MNELELLDRIAAILDKAPKGFTVYKRAANDEFFAVELSSGRLFNITAQEVKPE